MKNQYDKLQQKITKGKMLQKAYDKINYEKGLLTNEKRKLKQYKTG